MNDKEVYESVEDIKEIHEKTNVYNFELDKDNISKYKPLIKLYDRADIINDIA